jgi:hypothetical protein
MGSLSDAPVLFWALDYGSQVHLSGLSTNLHDHSVQYLLDFLLK